MALEHLPDGDLGLAPPPEPPKALSPAEILRLGALTLQAERSEAVEQLLMEQEQTYLEIYQKLGPASGVKALVAALLDRDRALANMGRQVADGRTASRLLREFMRAALYASGGRPDAQMVERALEKLGAEPADMRQLRLHGSTLGPLAPPEERAERLAKDRPQGGDTLGMMDGEGDA